MTKNTIIILIFIFLLTIALAASIDESQVPSEDRANFGITKFITGLFTKLHTLIFGNETKNSGNTNKNNNNSPLENKDLLQGDIMLTEEQADELVDKVAVEEAKQGIDISKVMNNETDVRLKRKFKADAKKWDLPIDYEIQKGDHNLIDRALKLIENKTCIRFNKIYWTSFGKPSLKYFRGNGCWSYIGQTVRDKPQDISIGVFCDTIGKIQHETMHALGVKHEQCRADRDDYLEIFPENVQYGRQNNFEKLDIDNALAYNISYDYGSDMHYQADAFSDNGNATMLPHDRLYNKTIGMDNGMTFLDAKLINRHYCSEVCPKSDIKCYNGGYENPNKCNTCTCVKGFGGKRCTDFRKFKKECDKQILFVTKEEQLLPFDGRKNCLIHLKAPYGKKVAINIKYINMGSVYDPVCSKKDSLEVKYYKDKTRTGALFCGLTQNITFTSHNDHVIVDYKSRKELSIANMTYKIF
ncbi:Astacin-like metalloendopeptidase [Strongyloides ratti]|uniref:Zinc metalloproteinase n=1 Tax=Strongyloides ratti TaxID=34506 RepID=A0A090LJE5_STRRB|nr:Astacin-like metalloendopeptidase [Strongyloides ratti]CEF69957.1 Astacin-like metalloendopeptidase [Strongyloides ratti]